ncbi:ribonuclease E/G [Alphaproteobacteria bacterium endosymbiont of Tiliacea citrago]|uniref:ribonuclease E/G n=1 Tax=Alphaproteobacteria bacterium endosymbiont of Tiliacea citrago TaxID=3077944 RepID=UPI00313ADBB3
MQSLKNFCFINDIEGFKTTVILLDENYKILQYKVLDKNNNIKLNNIYCGIVEKVDYSLESIFVRIAEDTIGFLPFKQLSYKYFDKETKKLKKFIKKGDKILVQVIRDSLEFKYLKLTNNITFASIFCVYMPFGNGDHGISSNIKADQRILIKSFLKLLAEEGTVIVRTSATESCIDEIQEDFLSLKKTYHYIYKAFKKANSFNLLMKNEDLVQVLRSYSIFLIEKVFVNNKKNYDLLKSYNDNNFIKFPSIEIKKDIKFLTLIENQLNSLYKKEILLPSNGSIIIEKTEAMITIDVNSKKNTKGKTMEETSFNINLEAVDIIVDQIILRNLGGIIAIDLIDMEQEEKIYKIYEKFKQAFKKDKASIKILPINALGVLQLSRERKGLSVFDLDYERCLHCENGHVLSTNFLIFDFMQKLSKYDASDNLFIDINIKLFNLIFKNHYVFIKPYKNVNWKIIEENNFFIK